jgi:hypothetical protein
LLQPPAQNRSFHSWKKWVISGPFFIDLFDFTPLP